MTAAPIHKGEIPFTIPSIDRPCFTSYKIIGDFPCGKPPIVCVHGGPGVPFSSFGDGTGPIGELWSLYGIPVIVYDQIGCGQSTHLPETAGDESFWRVSLFVDELNNLLDTLKLRDGPGFHLWAGSFGGYVACALAVTRPPGLQRLVLGSCIPSKELSVQSFAEVKAELPVEHQRAIDEAGRTGDFHSAVYKYAQDYMVKHYLFHQATVPEPMWKVYKDWDEHSIVKNAMSGRSPFFALGSMAGFTNVPKLHQITAPTLIYNSEFDTSSRDCAQKPFFELIPRVRWYKFADAGHTVSLESHEMKRKLHTLVGDFLCP